MFLHVHALHVFATLQTIAGRAGHLLHIHLCLHVVPQHVHIVLSACTGLLGRLLLLLHLRLSGLRWLCLRGLLLGRLLGRRRRSTLGLLCRLLILILLLTGVGNVGTVECSRGLCLLRRRFSRLVHLSLCGSSFSE